MEGLRWRRWTWGRLVIRRHHFSFAMASQVKMKGHVFQRIFQAWWQGSYVRGFHCDWLSSHAVYGSTNGRHNSSSSGCLWLDHSSSFTAQLQAKHISAGVPWVIHPCTTHEEAVDTAALQQSNMGQPALCEAPGSQGTNEERGWGVGGGTHSFIVDPWLTPGDSIKTYS